MASTRKRKRKAKRGEAIKWTAERKEIFFSELAELCNVSAAAKAAGFPSNNSAYIQKKKDPDFRERFEAAVAEGYERLELEMLERARFGENRPADVGEQSSEKLRQISTTLGLSLLKMHAARAKGAPPKPQRRPMRGANVRDEVLAMLSEMNRRLGGNG